MNMEILSLQFLYALGAIIVIDLVLAGDNAIVIALAARTLPKDLQRKAIVWGTVGAIVVRVLMTVVVVWLLKLPGLRLVGALLLIWIAFKLLVAEEHEDQHEVGMVGTRGTTFIDALRTIIIADAVMGLDNVLGVAGAAKGSYLLVVLGLAISIPIMIWGSTLILKWVDRYPLIIYLGAGVLAWTAATMMVQEPMLDGWFARHAWASWFLHSILVLGVVGVGHWRKRRLARKG